MVQLGDSPLTSRDALRRQASRPGILHESPGVHLSLQRQGEPWLTSYASLSAAPGLLRCTLHSPAAAHVQERGYLPGLL